jgi:hypothetical protein
MITTVERKAEVREAIARLVAWMNEAHAAHHAKHFKNLAPETYEVAGGRKYIRIAQVGQYGGRSVHCFVDAATGDVYKAGGWKAPALNGARYNILDADSLETLKAKWDPYTSYLYKR